MALTYRLLGRTGVLVSQLCLGTMNFADGTDDNEAERLVLRFSEEGGNFIDSANVYAAGKSEEMLGTVLSKLGMRDQFIVATKVRGKVGNTPNDQGASRYHIIREVESSLRRLRTDRIDLLQIHHPSPEIPIDETLMALDLLVKSGKIVYAGCSNFPAWTIMESLWASSALGLTKFVSEQAPYNLLDRRVERELLPMAQTYGLAVLPWGPLAGGMLSGKYRRDSQPPTGSRYTNDRYRGAPIAEPVWKTLEGLENLSSHKGITISQLALSWIINRPCVTSPVIGPRTVEQLEDNLIAAKVDLSEADLTRIDEIIQPGTFVKDYYTMRTAQTARW